MKKLGITPGVGLCDVIRTPKTPSSMIVTTGTLEGGGVVADVQTWQDGNFIEVSEVTGVPGFDVRFTFTNVIDFCLLGASAYYTSNNDNHFVEYQILDDTNTVWKTLWSFPTGKSFNYRYSDLPVTIVTRLADYINASNEVMTRFYHPVTGVNSHDLFIDYMSIIG